MGHKLGENNHKWSSKFGFLMAAVGSAVGLGNIWRFPYIAGEYGGAIFLLVYLLVVVVIGFPLLTVELSLGRYRGRNVIDTFNHGKGKKNWSLLGVLSLIICLLIVSYYCVIGGWIVKYAGSYMTGGGMFTSNDYTSIFESFTKSGLEPALYNGGFVIACLLVLVFGVKKGIENVSKFLMPALFVMLIFVAIVSLCMPGSGEGVKFFLLPDFDKIAENGGFGQIINAAMGQVFFSLSLGFGISCTYGSYLQKDSDIPKDSLVICGFDSLVAILAGFAILPAVASAGLDPTQGPGLIFGSLPSVFAALGGWFGDLVGFIFFALILVAALTSAISLLEVVIATIEQKIKIKRIWATVIVGGLVLITSTLVSLSQDPNMFGIDLLGLFDELTTKYMIPIAAFMTMVFINYIWRTNNAALEMSNGTLERYSWLTAWRIAIKYICPIAIIAIFILGLIPQ